MSTVKLWRDSCWAWRTFGTKKLNNFPKVDEFELNVTLSLSAYVLPNTYNNALLLALPVTWYITLTLKYKI